MPKEYMQLNAENSAFNCQPNREAYEVSGGGRMKITGADYLERLAEAESFTAKMVFNDQGAFIFTVQSQHRDMKAPGISYDHDARGNALAAMLKPGLIEIRFDPRFNNDRVMGILRKLLAFPELAIMKGWKVTYRGKPLNL